MKLRCVFYDPEVVDEDDRMTERALEACARAGVEVYELVGDEDVITVQGEEHDVPEDVGPFEFVLRAHGFERGEAIAVGASLEHAPVSAVWVGPNELEVRGPHVRVAEDEDQILYDAVITELAERR
jgi:hypothetical protein